MNLLVGGTKVKLTRQYKNMISGALKLRVFPYAVLFSALSSPVTGASLDLLSGTDLQESPLSLSLSKSIDITLAEQNQQLVISQYGILNKATIKQTANAANNIIVSQRGISNNLDISQQGYGNLIILEQQGNGNQADVIQEGDANIANVSQFGDQTIAIHQLGSEMVVNISQY